jgi:predicted peptidase
MRSLLSLAVMLVAGAPLASQTVAASAVTETALELPDGTSVRYAIALPDGYDRAGAPRPLVLALHPGGRTEYYGSSFMQGVVEPALRTWGAVIVAPDVPDRNWESARSERVVLALLEHVLASYATDREQVLVTGFSMGGGGAWYMAARHPEVFDGAIVIAGSPEEGDVASLAVPIYLIHSPDDEVVPFAGAETAYESLAARGHPVELRVLPGRTHFQMGAYVPALRVAGSWMLERWRAR